MGIGARRDAHGDGHRRRRRRSTGRWPSRRAVRAHHDGLRALVRCRSARRQGRARRGRARALHRLRRRVSRASTEYTVSPRRRASGRSLRTYRPHRKRGAGVVSGPCGTRRLSSRGCARSRRSSPARRATASARRRVSRRSASCRATLRSPVRPTLSPVRMKSDEISPVRVARTGRH